MLSFIMCVVLRALILKQKIEIIINQNFAVLSRQLLTVLFSTSKPLQQLHDLIYSLEIPVYHDLLSLVTTNIAGGQISRD